MKKFLFLVFLALSTSCSLSPSPLVVDFDTGEISGGAGAGSLNYENSGIVVVNNSQYKLFVMVYGPTGVEAIIKNLGPGQSLSIYTLAFGPRYKNLVVVANAYSRGNYVGTTTKVFHFSSWTYWSDLKKCEFFNYDFGRR